MAVDYAGAQVEWVTGTITLLQLVKDRLGITGTDQDAVLSMYISMAGAACESYLDNKLVQQSVTEYLACKRSVASLRYWPVVSLESVVIDGVDTTSDWELRTSDGVTWLIESIAHTSWTALDSQMEVTYIAGYDPLPGPVGHAIADTSVNYFNQTGGVGSVKKEVVQGVGSVEYVTNADSEGSVGLISGVSVSSLEMYRRWHV